MLRKEKGIPGKYYHLYNRGNHKELIFLDDRDRIRFLFLILFLQFPHELSNNEYHSTLFEKHGTFYFYKKADYFQSLLPRRQVGLVNFCPMPNHFHLTLRAKTDTGISKYMQRLLNAYTKYFNLRHKKSGHLFEGPYKLIPIASQEELLYLSAHIHRNPREMREWRGKENAYPYSSFQDYTTLNRWKDILLPETIVGELGGPNAYKKFVEGTSAKAIEAKLDEAHLITE